MAEYLLINYTNGVIASIDQPQLFEKHKHTFLHFSPTPSEQRLSFIALTIASHFWGKQYKNFGKLKSDLRLLQVHWNDPYNKSELVKYTSIPINYKKLKAHLLLHRKYVHKLLQLPELVCFWMDRSGDAAMNFYYKGEKGEITFSDGLITQQYGNDFPIKAQLNQEGILITSFSVLITKRIISMRTYLVTQSHLFHTSNWIFGLKEFLNDIISLLDISLNQLYLKAKYDKKDAWEFDIEVLGKNYGRRLNDKLKWVKAITGNNLNIEKQRKALNSIRQVRNHLNHFDPPIFSATLSEVSNWLNEAMDIVLIVLLIRKAAGEKFNDSLIELYLQPDVVFKPYAQRSDDVNHLGFGYDSVKYPTSKKNI